MKKTILLLLFGGVSLIYGQNVDSTTNVRKWIFKSKTDTIQPKTDTLFKNKKNPKPFEETFLGRNKIGLYADFVIQTAPFGDQKLYGASPFTSVGFMKDKRLYVGLNYSANIKGKYTNSNISAYPFRVGLYSLGLELGYHILPEKLIHFSPFVVVSHNWMRFDKGFYEDFYVDEEFYIAKDKYWSFRAGTDIFLNVTNSLRVGFNVNYSSPLNTFILKSITDKVAGIGYGIKLQFHTSFTNKK